MDNNNNNQNNQAFIRKNKNILVLVAAVALVIVLAILVSYSRTQAPAAPAAEAPAGDVSGEQTAAPESDGTSFDATYKAYEGKRLVITGECEIEPKVLTIAPDTTILAFNNSTLARTIVIDGATYKVGVKKYRTVKISQAGSLDVGCDGKSSVATVISR